MQDPNNATALQDTARRRSFKRRSKLYVVERDRRTSVTPSLDVARTPGYTAQIALPGLDRAVDPAESSRSRARNGSRFRAILVGSDIAAFIGSFAAARAAGLAPSASTSSSIALGCIVVALGVMLSSGYGLYARDEERADHSTVDDLPQVVHVALLVSWGVVVGLWITRNAVTAEGMVTLLMGSATLPLAARSAARAIDRRRPTAMQTTVIVGAGSVGQLLASKLINRPVHGLKLAGFVDDHPHPTNSPMSSVPFLGTIDSLPEIVEQHHIDRVVVAFSVQSHEQTVALLRSLRDLDVQVDVVPRLFDVLGPNVDVHTIDGLPLIARPRASSSRLARFSKRALDVVVAVIALVILSPILAAVALVIKLDSRGPTLYRGSRVGRGGKSFTQFKFRTMKKEFCWGPKYGGEDAERAFEQLLADRADLRLQYAKTHKLDPDPRITRVGRFLRSTSLDELPQLINVIHGTLSLVGPRPVTVAELDRYGEYVSRLLSVRPGLTGYWQVNGRSALTYDERVRLDLAYVSSWSLKLDATILLRTLHLVSGRAGAV